MGDGDSHEFTGRHLVGERRISSDGFEMDMLAAKLERAIANERAGQQARIGQHLEAIANSQHQSAVGRELLNRLHNRAEARNRATPEIIPVTEAATYNYGFRVTQRTLLVPNMAGGWPSKPRA